MRKQAIKKCIDAFNQIETAQDMRRLKITKSDHFEIGYIISEAVQAYNERRSYKAKTIKQSVFRWFMRHGAKVEPCGIGWRIIF